jgi:hypothetical protein
MFALPTEPSRIGLEIVNLRATSFLKQVDDDTDREISQHKSEDPAVSTLSSAIEEDDLDNQQEILHLDQARHYITIQTAMVPLPKKWSGVDTVITRTSLPNL